MNSLRAVDLNLLVVLDAMLLERHVSRAAVRLNMSQPAVSHALNRLRGLLGDPLFVRTPAGLTPTSRALALAEPLQEALSRVRKIVAEPSFDPAKARHTFRLSMSDYGAGLVLPGLLSRLRSEAPGVELRVTQGSREEMLQQVQEGEVDVALGVFPSLPADIRAARIVQERFVCIADRANPVLYPEGLTLETYLRASHILVSVRDEPVGEVEAALTALGYKRRIVTILPHFLVAPELVVGTDLLLTLASRAVDRYAEDPRLSVAELPFAVAPFDFVQIWHARSDDSQAAAWLRIRIAGACGPRRPPG